MNELIEEIEKSIYHTEFEKIPALLLELIQETDINTTAEKYVELIMKKFTHHKADYCAKLMEIAISTNKDLAKIYFPNNPFFRLAIFKGSVDLYECYIEEYIEPLIKNNNIDELEVYLELFAEAEKISALCNNNFERVIKGVHYNGAFPNQENEHILSIHKEDFEIMNDLAENYNSIVGRIEIMKNLESRL